MGFISNKFKLLKEKIFRKSLKKELTRKDVAEFNKQRRKASIKNPGPYIQPVKKENMSTNTLTNTYGKKSRKQRRKSRKKILCLLEHN